MTPMAPGVKMLRPSRHPRKTANTVAPWHPVPQPQARTLGETLIDYMEKNPRRSANQLARELSEAGVPTDKRKVMRWRAAGEGKRIAPSAAAALDRIFKTINVFG